MKPTHEKANQISEKASECGSQSEKKSIHKELHLWKSPPMKKANKISEEANQMSEEANQISENSNQWRIQSAKKPICKGHNLWRNQSVKKPICEETNQITDWLLHWSDWFLCRWDSSLMGFFADGLASSLIGFFTKWRSQSDQWRSPPIDFHTHWLLHWTH